MPRPARPWFRFYTEAVHDRKMRRLTPAQRWLWVAVLAAARESCRPGYLMVSEFHGYDNADLADYAGMKPKEVSDGATLLERHGMIAYDDDIKAWHVTNWNDRQFESDDVTARTAKHRSKEQRRNVPTTLVGTPPDTETDTETETIRRRRPTIDFQPTDAHQTFAAKNGLNLNGERVHWIDHCEAKGVTYERLNAGFSTWLHNAVNFGRGRGRAATNGVDPDAMSRRGTA